LSGAYDCKLTICGKGTGQLVNIFMFNVKIQNKKENLSGSNYMSRFCGVSCQNSTGFVSLIDNIYQCVPSECVVQGDVGIDTDVVSSSNETTEQNVGFSDPPNNVISSIPHPMSYLKVDASQNIELGDFLKRPVQIYSKNWIIGGTLDAASDNFNPWFSFFDKASIKRKLDNYYMVRCNLHLKFVINASPFYYGCAIAAYQPMVNFNPAPVVLSSLGRKENIPFSQRPHIYLYPQNSQGGEMVLPFLYHKNWLNATSASDLTNMGQIILNSFNPLLNANGVAGESISILVYAWAEDIEVAGPTPSLAVQGSYSKKDEYSHDGVVSRPASAIARTMGRLKDLPVIGEFATATSYAAGAVADIAALFGFTNVPVIDDVHAFVPKPFANLAATDIGTPIEKLVLDSKNELSIDPKISGADVEDELLISSFVQRESYIFNSSWAAADPIDTSLFYVKVSPNLNDDEHISGAEVVYSTPMSHVARCFEYWRGDIIFRFKFICTKYHRGRVRVNWAPFGGIGTSGDYTTETYTRVIDITEDNDVEFCVPYTQPTSYLRHALNVGPQMSQSGTSTSGLGQFYNGILTVRVLNQQTSPVSSADINILVFARGAANLEFAGPVDIPSTFSPYAVQSDYDLDQSRYELGMKPSTADPNTNLIYMGESIVSLRSLMRRMGRYIRFARDSTLTVDTRHIYHSTLGRQPLYPGYDPNGLQEAVGLVSTLTESYNYAAWNYTTWFSTCFVGNRGSYHYIVHPYAPNEVLSLEVSRSEGAHTNSDDNLVEQYSAISAVGAYERSFANTGSHNVGMSGLSMTSQKNLAGTTVSLPMYSRFKFLSNSVTNRTNGTSIDESDTDSFRTSAVVEYINGASTDAQFTQDMYVSCGTDFSLIFFLNVPVMYNYTAIPSAV
jgi:hypothetical protein